MTAPAFSSFVSTIWAALDGPAEMLARLEADGDGALASTFRVTDLAAASVGVAGLAVAELVSRGTGGSPAVRVDRRLASFWFRSSLRPDGWRPPPPWDPIAGDYRAGDGWIRLHTNAPHHRRAAEGVLDARDDRAAVAAAVARWAKADLERAVVAAGGCAAEMNDTGTWAAHPQGLAVAAEPLVHRALAAGTAPGWRPSAARPLAGIRVLDLTRVLAGPTATRVLAGFGADVLRIDPPGWEEPSLAPEITLGKRCARLDLHRPDDRARFEALLAGADILVHGYRADALDRLGYGLEGRRALAPGLIDVRLNAYGWSGPWRDRRGFDSLVQMSAGIAEAGMRHQGADKPAPLPVQALDYATGYMMAAAAIRGLTDRMLTGRVAAARLSLARTARLLVEAGVAPDTAPLAAETQGDRDPAPELTEWGAAQRLRAPLGVEAAPMRWDLPASSLGSAEAVWG